MRTCNEPEALLLIRFLSPCMDCAILAEINSSAQSSNADARLSRLSPASPRCVCEAAHKW